MLYLVVRFKWEGIEEYIRKLYNIEVMKIYDQEYICVYLSYLVFIGRLERV